MAKRRPRFEALEDRICLSLQATFSLPTGAWRPTVYRASPIFVDIFGTGKDDLIAVASGAQLVAYAENADGSASPVVSYKIPSGIDGLFADIKATPVVVTDPSTGRQDLFDAMGGDINDADSPEDGRIFGWDLQTGNLLPAFAAGIGTGNQPLGFTGVYGALTTGYLQGNNMPPDLIVTSFSHEITALTLQGNILWQWSDDDSVLSGAVVADIDRDGSPEVVVGGDSSASPYYQNGGWVNVLSSTGQLKWRRQIVGETTWSSPVVADLNNNGYLDIVIGTGDNFSHNLGGNYTAEGDYLYAFDPFGNMLPGWPYHTTFTGDTQGHEVLGAPAVADLTGDGQLDVVALDRAGYVHVIQPNGQDLPGFVGGKQVYPTSTPVDDYGSPTIADVTGQGKPDIIVGFSYFLRAFDPSGNEINIGTTPVGSANIPEGLDEAPAVGNFDGSGGLCLAVVTWDAANPVAPNRPDQVQIYHLPPSTLTPPWPFLRRTITGDAVMRSPAYDQQYVAQAFNTLLGSVPGQATLQPYVNSLNSDTGTLLTTAEFIAISAPVEQAEVSRVYEAYLGRAVDPGSLSYWTTYLATHTYRQMEVAIAATPEFARRAGNSPAEEVVLLYQAILARSPSQAEINGWVATGLPPGSIASAILNAPETLDDQWVNIIQAMFGQGTAGLIPADDEPTYSLDIHAGDGEAAIISDTLASAGSLAATNFVAGYVENVYRDVLGRAAAPAEVASWIASVDNGSVAFGSIAPDILNSTEAKDVFINDEFLTLLGRPADAGALASLASQPSREAVLIAIVGSPEYYAHNGSNNTSFVTDAFRDLAAFSISGSALTGIVNQLNTGMTTDAGVAQGIIYDGTLYFANLVVNQLMYYIPIESQGVLRTGELPTDAPGQPINPDPGQINYFEGLYEAGVSDTQVIDIILSSPQYVNEVAYYRGIYRSPGVRF